LPKLTYLVVQQRNKARFALDGQRGAEHCNPGTIIDSKITSQETPNFYMLAQKVLKGTGRPCHVHVWKDTAKHKLEHIERFAYDLCFLYARATKVVSRPAPVYYAHRAAFLARYYEPNFKEVTDMMETGSTSSNGSGSSRASTLPDIKLEMRTANTVYFA